MIAGLRDQKPCMREIAQRLLRHSNAISPELCRSLHRSDGGNLSRLVSRFGAVTKDIRHKAVAASAALVDQSEDEG
ncbi:hypothetical protein J2D73_11570 [Acetobacter sacchari]|uniref:Uncharacterized protein n=1 Tax=Acetobacter sacchari TaxID=2661687 RepID=A0ABS3LWZ7_9PROT|nr:hypothetical protein [Acetobacter sacchari]